MKSFCVGLVGVSEPGSGSKLRLGRYCRGELQDRLFLHVT